MTVSDFLEQPCNMSDNAVKLVACKLFVSNWLQQLGTNSANTTCQQLVNSLFKAKLALYSQVFFSLNMNCDGISVTQPDLLQVVDFIGLLQVCHLVSSSLLASSRCI